MKYYFWCKPWTANKIKVSMDIYSLQKELYLNIDDTFLNHFVLIKYPLSGCQFETKIMKGNEKFGCSP